MTDKPEGGYDTLTGRGGLLRPIQSVIDFSGQVFNVVPDFFRQL